ncbi:hypothetical protein AVEN_39758-1 [Araneus ventricosus]|uniref:CCHC-type domain-containing protein n=1 Tax=Araneus ventricosus TaxID=182803 RepID=A0A4Y2I5T1_ARAVE|nr:hypothetical protein AVEN_39758-1 [Araneus ventricosus]
MNVVCVGGLVNRPMESRVTKFGTGPAHNYLKQWHGQANDPEICYMKEALGMMPSLIGLTFVFTGSGMCLRVLKKCFKSYLTNMSVLLIFPRCRTRVYEQSVRCCDDWSKLNSPDDLVVKLDDYDTLRSTFRSKQPCKEGHYDKRNSFKDDPAISTNEKKKLYCITDNERGELKCFNCSNFGHISRNCSLPKSVLTCRECDESGHKAINCVAKENNHSGDKKLSVGEVGKKLEKNDLYLKKVKLNNCVNMQALIDTGSSCCLLKISVAQKLKLKLEPAVNKIYGFGNKKMPALTSIGKIKADIELDNVKAERISIYVVSDDAQSVDLIITRTWLFLILLLQK